MFLNQLQTFAFATAKIIIPLRTFVATFACLFGKHLFPFCFFLLLICEEFFKIDIHIITPLNGWRQSWLLIDHTLMLADKPFSFAHIFVRLSLHQNGRIRTCISRLTTITADTVLPIKLRSEVPVSPGRHGFLTDCL